MALWVDFAANLAKYRVQMHVLNIIKDELLQVPLHRVASTLTRATLQGFQHESSRLEQGATFEGYARLAHTSIMGKTEDGIPKASATSGPPWNAHAEDSNRSEIAIGSARILFSLGWLRFAFGRLRALQEPPIPLHVHADCQMKQLLRLCGHPPSPGTSRPCAVRRSPLPPS